MPIPPFIKTSLCLAFSLGLTAAPINAAVMELPLQQAITHAQHNDLGQLANEQRSKALLSQSVAAYSLPDPTVSLGAANLPVNSFDTRQEPMTQLQLSVYQALPRGDSLALQRDQYQHMSVQQQYMQADRRARVALTVAERWLEAYQHQQSLALIQQSRVLFSHLLDVTQSHYANTSATNAASQQDVIRAQVELSRLDEQQLYWQQQYEVSKARLNEWPVMSEQAISMGYDFALPTTPLQAQHLYPQLNQQLQQDINQSLRGLSGHPKIMALASQVQAEQTQVELEKQKYQPEWGIKASYGYRDDDLAGQPRDDFFSLGVTFSLPLFTAKRQDPAVQAAVYQAEALRTEQQLMLRTLAAQYQAERHRLRGLQQREQLLQQQLLPQLAEQVQAALNAYTHNAGDFDEVIRARIAELEARISVLALSSERFKIMARLNYLHSRADSSQYQSQDNRNE